jgi:hypothetical protein
MMPSEPLKRIYFDTNWLRRWPNPANNVPAVRRAANWMDTEIYIPETVEDELAAMTAFYTGEIPLEQIRTEFSMKFGNKIDVLETMETGAAA